MTPTFEILSNLFGVLGVCSTVVIYQQKRRRSLLLSKLASDILWFLHYLFLGAYSGAAIAAVGVLREIIFARRTANDRRGKLWLPVFLAVSILSTVLTMKNWFALLAAIASCLSVVSFFIGKPKLSRILSFPISACMLTYDVVNSSIAGIINEIFALCSSAVGLIILDRKRSYNNDTAEQA